MRQGKEMVPTATTTCRQTDRKRGGGEESGEGDRVNNRFLVAAAGKWQLPTG